MYRQSARPRLLSIVIASAIAVNCGGGSSPAAPTPTAPPGGGSARLALSIAPDPIVEDPRCLCGGLPNRVAAIGRLTIRETEGVGVRIDGLRATAQQLATGTTTFMSDFTSADVAGHAAGSNRVTATGTLDVIDVGGHYDRSVSGAATMRIDVRGTDDRGNAIEATLTVSIAP